MRTSSLEFLLMMTSTPLVNWSVAINPRFGDCCGNLRARTWPWPMTWRRRRSCALTNTFAAFVAKPAFPPGFIGLPTTVFAKKREGVKSLSALMKKDSNRSPTRRSAIRP